MRPAGGLFFCAMGSGRSRDETEKERLDRNLDELLGELRVALPGVQVLFAFLLVVPFNQRFADITSFQRSVYFVTLLLATAASACLIAPTAHHRLEFRADDKQRIVFGATRLAIVGLTLLALAMTGAVMFVTDFLYGTTTVAIVSVLVALLFAFLWYACPSGACSTSASPERASQLDRARLPEGALEPHQQAAVLEQQHVLSDAEFPLLEVVGGRAVEEEVRRPGDPDRVLAVERERVDAGRLAGDLRRVLGVEVATELVDEQAEPGAGGLGQPGRARYSSDRRPPGTLLSTNTASGRPAAPGTSGSKPSFSRAPASVVRSPTAGGRGRGFGGSCSRRSTVAPRRPKKSSTESRTLGTAAKTPPARSSTAGERAANDRREKTAGAEPGGAGAAIRAARHGRGPAAPASRARGPVA